MNQEHSLIRNIQTFVNFIHEMRSFKREGSANADFRKRSNGLLISECTNAHTSDPTNAHTSECANAHTSE